MPAAIRLAFRPRHRKSYGLFQADEGNHGWHRVPSFLPQAIWGERISIPSRNPIKLGTNPVGAARVASCAAHARSLKMDARDFDKSTNDGELASELRALRKEVRRLNDHRFIRVQNSVPRMLGFMLLRGLALGLGTVIGASVLVSILIFFLSQIDFIPIIGDWASDFAEQIAAEVGQDVPAEANEDGSIEPGAIDTAE